jgi:tetratricopeptide (TPR) repeat protein
MGGATVFTRTGYVYVVFDRRFRRMPEVELGPQTPPIGEVQGAAIGEVTAMRFRLPAGFEPAVQKDGDRWQVLLVPPRAPRPFALSVAAEPDHPLGARIVVQAEGANRVVRFSDPEVGDELFLIPLPNAPQAVMEQNRFAELELIPTLQGIAVRPLRDDLLVRALDNIVEISGAGGVALSSRADRDIIPRPVEASRLFDLASWRRGPIEQYIEMRQKLLDAIVEVPQGDVRERRRLDLARFYFAHGFGPEAQGALDVVAQALPTAAVRPEFRALRGAARVWAGRPEEGMADLTDRSLDGDLEVTLWRGVGSAVLGNWPSARGSFSRAEAALAAYPEPFFTRFSLLAAEAALHQNDAPEALRLLDRLDQRRPKADEPPLPASQYLRGWAELRNGKPETAAQHWRAVTETTGDRLALIRSEFGLVDLDLSAERVTRRQAIERLERLTFAWRGDELEINVRRRLAQLQMDEGDVPQAFQSLKTLIELFPNHSMRPDLEREMADTFTRLFVRDGAAVLSPLNALAFYDEWRNLTPQGKAGDDVIARLAERLVQVDLLDRAASLLEMQVRDRLHGSERAAVGARLAAIRLLDGKPELAAQAIEISSIGEGAPDLMQERRLLYARALADMGRSEQALRLLDGDNSRPADFLRIDIAWRAQRWREAERALGALVGPPPPTGRTMPGELRRALLNRSVALALTGDANGLAELRRAFSPSMENTPEFDTFRLLTRPEQATGLLDIRTIQERVREVDLFQGFLTEYKRRLVSEVPAAAGTARVN